MCTTCAKCKRGVMLYHSTRYHPARHLAIVTIHNIQNWHRHLNDTCCTHISGTNINREEQRLAAQIVVMIRRAVASMWFFTYFGCKTTSISIYLCRCASPRKLKSSCLWVQQLDRPSWMIMDNGERARQSTLRTSLMISTLEIACARFVMRAAIFSGEYVTCVLPFLQLPTGILVKKVFVYGRLLAWSHNSSYSRGNAIIKDKSATSCGKEIVGEVWLPLVDGWWPPGWATKG